MEIYKFALVLFASAATAEQAPLLDGHLLVDFKAGEATGNHVLMGFKPDSIEYMEDLAKVYIMVRTGNPGKDRWIQAKMQVVIDCIEFKTTMIQSVMTDYQTGSSGLPMSFPGEDWSAIEYRDWGAPLYSKICESSHVDEVTAWAGRNHDGVVQSVSERMIGLLDVTDAGQINWRVNPDAEPVPNELGSYLVANNPNFSR